METALRSNQKNNSGKGVKMMKKLLFLAATVLFVVATANCFAQTVPTNPAGAVTTTQTTASVTEYWFNAYGVAMGAKQVSTTTTSTTENGQTAKTITTQTAISDWRGGSLKIADVSGTSETKNPDGKVASKTAFWTDYNYNASGYLTGATGGSNSESSSYDSTGKVVGSSWSHTDDSYAIKDGQATRNQSISYGTQSGPSGQVAGYFYEKTSYDYVLKGGSYQTSKETTYSENKGVDNSFETTTKVKEYTRDANGVCTGIKMSIPTTAPGAKLEISATGGKEYSTLSSSGYSAISAYDSKAGYYTSYEKTAWTPTTTVLTAPTNAKARTKPFTNINIPTTPTTPTSAEMVSNAWASLDAGNYSSAISQANEVISAFGSQALQQQSTLTDFAPAGHEADYWALNDVATAYFILAEAQKAQGNTTQAKTNYQYIVTNLKFAQCFDPDTNSYWKVAQAAQEKINALP
jgi:hypothetical protein